MSDQSTMQDDIRRFHEEADKLRQAGRQKGSLSKETREQLRTLVSRVLAVPDVDLERIQSDLTQFPPSVIGHAIASQWISLPADRLRVLRQRLESLESDRQVGEKLALALSLLKRPATKSVAGEVLATLPQNKEALTRIRAEFFSEDGGLLEMLEAPADYKTALSLWGVFLKAAEQPKAQEWRRYNLLVKVLGWLADDGRFERTDCQPLVAAARAIRSMLGGHAAQQFSKDVDANERWNAMLGVPRSAPESSPPKMPATLSPARLPKPVIDEQPTTGARPIAVQSEVIEETPKAAVGEAEAPMGLSEAELVAANRASRLTRESRAIEALLVATEAARAREVQATRDLRRAYDDEERATLRADEATARVADLEVELAKTRKESDRHDRSNRESARQLSELQQQLAARSTECEALEGRLRLAEETHAHDRAAWEERVVTNADARLDEFKRRTASRINKLMADVPPRSQHFADTLTSVLNDRLHEVFDALRADGINVADKG